MSWIERTVPPTPYLTMQAVGVRDGKPMQQDCSMIDSPFNRGAMSSLAISASRSEGVESVKVFDGQNVVIFDWRIG